MSDDTMTKIRLGIVMPQLEEKIKPGTQEILTSIGEIIKKGSPDGEKVAVDEVKKIFLEGLEKMLDALLPDVDTALNPPPPAPPEEPADESATAEAA